MNRLLTVKEAAPVLNISVIKMRRLLQDNVMPCHKIGRRYLFTENDLNVFLDSVSLTPRANTAEVSV